MVTVHREHEYGAATTVTPVSEAAGAIAVMVLAVLGLVGVVPGAMVAIATIVVGAAILLEGAQVVGEYSRLVATADAAAGTPVTWGGGVTLEFLAGGAGIVLGILALFSNTPTLTPAALIVFGATLLLNGCMMAAASQPAAAGAEGGWRMVDAIAAQVSGVASGAQIMVGIAAIVLGIIALVSAYTTTLTLVGLLAIGASLLMSAASTGGLVLSVLRT